MNKNQQSRRRRKYKSAGLLINQELRDIIHGYIMSDGYLRQDGTLTVDQSAGLGASPLVEWMGEKLKALRTAPAPSGASPVKRTHSRTGTTRGFAPKRFNTRSLLIGFHKIWYKPYTDAEGNRKFKKVLPKNVGSFFTPGFITVWFAGDGGRPADCVGARFEVTCFSVEERLYLKKLFMEKYGIDARINKAGASKAGTLQWTLSILADDYDKFRAIITKYDLIEKVFPYKLCKK